MAKPVTLPVWAEDANYPAGAEPEAGTPTKVTPASTYDDVGYRPEQKPKAQNLNYMLYWLSQWASYLNSNAFVGNHSITGDLNVTGDLDVDDDVNIDGDLQVDLTANVGGLATVGSLSVTGAAALNGNVTGTPNFTDIPTFVGGTSTQPWTATEYKHTGVLTLPISGWNSCLDTPGAAGGLAQGTGGCWTLGTSTYASNPVIYPIELPVGTRITGYEVYLTKVTAGTDVIRARLYRQHDTGGETTAGAEFINDEITPGDTSLPASENVTVAAQYHYYIKVGGGGTTGNTVWRVEVFYDRP